MAKCTNKKTSLNFMPFLTASLAEVRH